MNITVTQNTTTHTATLVSNDTVINVTTSATPIVHNVTVAQVGQKGENGKDGIDIAKLDLDGGVIF